MSPRAELRLAAQLRAQIADNPQPGEGLNWEFLLVIFADALAWVFIILAIRAVWQFLFGGPHA